MFLCLDKLRSMDGRITCAMEDIVMRRTLVAFCLLTLVCAAWVSPALADPGRGAYVLCYVWANVPSPTAPYSPASQYSYNAVGRANANIVTKTGTGTYTVTCGGVGGGALFSGSGTWGAGGHVQVTAYGSGPSHCKVNGWSTGGADFSASVSCYSPNGAPVDSFFDLLFVW
jgi:hypothetical protein